MGHSLQGSCGHEGPKQPRFCCSCVTSCSLLNFPRPLEFLISASRGSTLPLEPAA